MFDELSYAFTIFFLTLGPIKTIPGFAMISADLNPPATKALALRGIVLGTLIVFATAFIFSGTMSSWRVSLPAMQIAGGLLLFISASHNITSGLGNGAGAALTPQPVQKSLDPEAKARALSPLAVPTIVTPYGIVAILLFVNIAKQDPSLRAGIYGLLVLIMLMNFVGMWFAKQIVHALGIPTFRLLGWIFSVLQAGLAVQVVVGASRMLKIVSPA